MKKLIISIRNGWNQLKKLIKSGVSHLHVQAGISVVDEITALAAEGKTAIDDITPVVNLLPVNAAAKAEITKIISEVAPVLKSVSTPGIVEAIKTALAAEIVKIVSDAVTGGNVDVASIEADIKTIFAAEDIAI